MTSNSKSIHKRLELKLTQRLNQYGRQSYGQIISNRLHSNEWMMHTYLFNGQIFCFRAMKVVQYPSSKVASILEHSNLRHLLWMHRSQELLLDFRFEFVNWNSFAQVSSALFHRGERIERPWTIVFICFYWTFRSNIGNYSGAGCHFTTYYNLNERYYAIK